MSTGVISPAGQTPVDVRPAYASDHPQGVHHRPVPWTTVLPLAIALSFADGFWVVTLRTAVGSVERTEAPFVSWLLESALLVPMFTLAVLGVLMRVRRRTGPHPRRFGPVAGVGLRVAGAGAGVGVVVLLGNAWLDTHLQVEHLEHMGSMGGTCFASCLENREQATLVLQSQAAGVGIVLMILTNVVLVAWLLALRGWQLRLAPHEGGDTRAPAPHRTARLLLALGLLGAGLIHLSVVADHLEEWWVEGAFFVLLAVAEIATACLVLLTRRHPRGLVVAVVVSAGPLVLWLVSRTVGIPVGPDAWEPEAVGLADGASTVLEQVTLVLALAQLRGTTILRRRLSQPATLRVALVGLLTLTALGVGSGLSVLGQGHGHDEQEASWTPDRPVVPRPSGAP